MKHTLSVNRNITVVKIALTGELRSGKDEAAKHLWLNHGFDRFAFGEKLKRTMYEVFPWVDAASKPRALMQNYGQLMRELDSEVWIRHVERSIAGTIEMKAGNGADFIGVVVSDLRQPNEFDWARANGFTVVRVNAKSGLRLARAQMAGDAFKAEDLTHDTESHISGFSADWELYNDGTIEELREQVDELLAKIKEAV
jgi:dephospho-CoA kinase